MARVPALPPNEWTPEMGRATAALRPPDALRPTRRGEGRPKGLGILGTMANHPDLAAAFFAFNGHLLYASTLSPRHRELSILRVAARRGCDYEWIQHAVLAGDAGLGAEEIARVAEGPDARGWSEIDAALLRAVDELVAGASVSDTTWDRLRAGLDERQVMDLVFTVGGYDLLAMAIGAFGVELDADLAEVDAPPRGEPAG